jgi:cytochrome P450
VQPEDIILMNLRGLHHDPKVWGDDADVFRPERFLNGGWESLPPNSWKAFGDGMRACIGRTFAEQEMIMTVALILQKFQVELADPGYQLRKYTFGCRHIGALLILYNRGFGHNHTKAQRSQDQGTETTWTHNG